MVSSPVPEPPSVSFNLRQRAPPWGFFLFCERNEFLVIEIVQSARRMSESASNQGKPGPARAADGADRTPGFSFGSRRYASRGPRRLFVMQECAMYPVYEANPDRPRGILRVSSSCG